MKQCIITLSKDISCCCIGKEKCFHMHNHRFCSNIDILKCWDEVINSPLGDIHITGEQKSVSSCSWRHTGTPSKSNINLVVSFELINSFPGMKNFSKYNYRKVDFSALYASLANIDWTPLLDAECWISEHLLLRRSSVIVGQVCIHIYIYI